MNKRVSFFEYSFQKPLTKTQNSVKALGHDCQTLNHELGLLSWCLDLGQELTAYLEDHGT